MKSIKDIDKQDRPREKLLSKGVKSLTNLELLQIIIGSGVQGSDVTTISKQILKILETNKGSIDFDVLTAIRGVSIATASKIISSLELMDRFVDKGTQIRSVEDVLPLLIDIKSKKQEHFITFTIDGANRLIEKRLVSIGTLNTSIVHPREVFADAISDRAAAIIVAHNHPSGTLIPSEADIEVTKRLRDAGKILGINLIDHIIIAENGFVVV